KSRSYPRKSGSSVSPDIVGRLLRDGEAFQKPSDEISATANFLETTGLVRNTRREYVVCANPQDADFPPRNRQCTGLIHLDASLDEAGNDLICPECDRPVYPVRYRKQRFHELRVSVLADGVESFVLSLLTRARIAVTRLEPGVFRAV